MKETMSRKQFIKIGTFYGVIVAIINYFGYLIMSSQDIPVHENEAYLFWMNFINTHNVLMRSMSVIVFGIPTALIIYILKTTNKDNIEGRFISLPLTLSLIGSLGWSLSFFLEFIVLIHAYITVGVNVAVIVVNSFLNIAQGCIFIFTLAFLILETINRHYMLPKFFPHGNLMQYKGSHKISTIGIMSIFYFSVGIFPVFFLTTMIRNYSLNLGFEITRFVYYMVFGIIIFGIILLFIVSNYFSSPIKKLKNATENIKTENFGERIDVVSCDDIGELADNFNSMSISLQEKNQKIHAISDSIIKGMAVMVESRDNSTGGHIMRTSDCVKIFVNKLRENDQMNLSKSFCKAVIKAAPMHDLGKIAVDDKILRKPGRFEPDEFEQMKTHAEKGAVIVSKVLTESDDEESNTIAINVAHYHHEKWNGEGYPEKISGEDIPLEARIMALADVFDALVSKRCYKESMTYDQAFAIIEESLGSHFDPVLGKAFIECRPELEALYNSY